MGVKKYVSNGCKTILGCQMGVNIFSMLNGSKNILGVKWV